MFESAVLELDETRLDEYAKLPWFGPNPGPGGLYVMECFRLGDHYAFAEVVQQFLFDHPEVGERLHDQVEKMLMRDDWQDDQFLPGAEEAMAEFYSQPTVYLKFMDTMEEAGVDYSHGIELRVEDLADFSQELEETAMSFKSLNEKMDQALTKINALTDVVGAINPKLNALTDTVGVINPKLNSLADTVGVIKPNHDENTGLCKAVVDNKNKVDEINTKLTGVDEKISKMASQDWFNLRFAGVIVLTFLAGLGVANFDAVKQAFGF